jgi:hypothetical protein
MRFLDQHAAFAKQLRSLGRERSRLQRAQGNAPVVPLERAFQRGWEKTYVLRADIHHRPDRRVFSEVLPFVNQRVYSRTREFQSREGKPIALHPRIIPVAEWRQLAWPASHQRWFAYGHWRIEDRPWIPPHWSRHILGFRLVRSWWLEEQMRPFMITHQRVELPEVRRRLAEIERYMDMHSGWERLMRLHGRSRWWRHLSSTRSELRQESSDESHLADSFT